MVIKGLRQKKHWSQEQLAESSGLSLRTIQRIESRGKISFESLHDLAAVFDMTVIELKRELVMDKTSLEWKKRPFWVRLMFFGSGRVRMNQQEFQKVEIFSAIAGAAFLVSGLTASAGIMIPHTMTVPLLFSGSMLFLGAYLMSIAARAGDKHSVWHWVESSTGDD